MRLKPGNGGMGNGGMGEWGNGGMGNGGFGNQDASLIRTLSSAPKEKYD